MTSAIEVNNLSKRYRKGRGLTNLRELLSFRGRSESEQYHWAVRDVSFTVQPGEALGIIGPNGAGKTTILKLLSNVTKPTSGEVRVNGRFSALIELGAGFHPDLTGRENVFLNGAILGMKRDEIQRRFDEIVDFAGIGDYLDTPVKRYSSGMYARLGFSIAAHVEPDVLLVDEVLAVGDFAFREKCYARMQELRALGTSLIFVSHSFEAVSQVCDAGLVMYRGQPLFQGDVAAAIGAYSNAIRAAAKESASQITVPLEGGIAQRVMTLEAEISNVSIVDVNDSSTSSVASGDHFAVIVEAVFTHPVQHPVFGITIRTQDSMRVYDTNTHWENIETPNFDSGDRVKVRFLMHANLIGGIYDIDVGIVSDDLSCLLDLVDGAASLVVRDKSQAKGIADLEANISIARSETMKPAELKLVQ